MLPHRVTSKKEKKKKDYYIKQLINSPFAARFVTRDRHVRELPRISCFVLYFTQLQPNDRNLRRRFRIPGRCTGCNKRCATFTVQPITGRNTKFSLVIVSNEFSSRFSGTRFRRVECTRASHDQALHIARRRCILSFPSFCGINARRTLKIKSPTAPVHRTCDTRL